MIFHDIALHFCQAMDTLLSGSLPASFSLMTAIAVLDLSKYEGMKGPSLTGAMQAIMVSNFLVSLHLNDNRSPSLSQIQINVSINNRFSGTIDFGMNNECPKLTSILVSGNRFLVSCCTFSMIPWLWFRLSGTIRKDFAGLRKRDDFTTSLENIAIGMNRISGQLPTEICKLSGLKRYGSNNQRLSGTLPACLGSLTRLTVVYVYMVILLYFFYSAQAEIFKSLAVQIFTTARNYFEGSLPESMNSLTSLETLFLMSNSFTVCTAQKLICVTASCFP